MLLACLLAPYDRMETTAGKPRCLCCVYLQVLTLEGQVQTLQGQLQEAEARASDEAAAGKRARADQSRELHAAKLQVETAERQLKVGSWTWGGWLPLQPGHSFLRVHDS